MKVEIPDALLAGSNLTEQELKLQLALFLYSKNILTLEAGSHFAGLDAHAFQKKIGENKIPVHYTQKDFEDDLRTLNEP
jgi:predicted HTH domain antitoxin